MKITEVVNRRPEQAIQTSAGVRDPLAAPNLASQSLRRFEFRPIAGGSSVDFLSAEPEAQEAAKTRLHDVLYEAMIDPLIGLRDCTREQFNRELKFAKRNVDSVSLLDVLVLVREKLAPELGWEPEQIPDRIMHDAEFAAIKTVGEAVDTVYMSVGRYLRGEFAPYEGEK